MPEAKGRNIAGAKQYNRGLALKLVITGECHSRIGLSRKTGLTKMTITNIVSEFLADGILEEREEERTENCGRNPIILSVAPGAPRIVGALIFRDRVEAVLCDLCLNILHRERISFSDTDERQLMEDCFTVIDRCLTAAGDSRIAGIGAASIGPVDTNRGILLNPPRFYGISGLPILELLKNRYPAIPVVFDHDNNSAALAENMFGNAIRVSDFIFLGVSNGIGSGIVLDGEVFHNHRGYAPEIGFLTVDPNGPEDESGRRGTLEMYASTSVVLEKLKKIPAWI